MKIFQLLGAVLAMLMFIVACSATDDPDQLMASESEGRVASSSLSNVSEQREDSPESKSNEALTINGLSMKIGDCSRTREFVVKDVTGMYSDEKHTANENEEYLVIAFDLKKVDNAQFTADELSILSGEKVFPLDIRHLRFHRTEQIKF